MSEEATYPAGITQADHIAHDLRVGRFPKQSSLATFLAERAAQDEGLEAKALRWAERHEASERRRLRDMGLPPDGDMPVPGSYFVRELVAALARARGETP